jgi:esterase/lipase superfamily enzyme
VTILKDKLPASEVKALVRKHKLSIDENADWYASLRVACELFERARSEKKHLLFFVHGYNNDIGDVIKAARDLESLYNLIVVPFSWPANGGGPISGTAAYLSDKDDARSSATALHRFVLKAHAYHALLTAGLQEELRVRAVARHPENHEQAQALYGRLLEQECNTSINLLCHSMGNYVLKYATLPSSSALRLLAFDNIALVAADANNPGHEGWVRLLPVRNRLYVVINENDSALKWSRVKPGDEQEERLGHHLRNLVAPNAYYVDVTRMRGVGSEHSYFKGAAASGNATLRRLFARIFEGGRAEEGLQYQADINVYR